VTDWDNTIDATLNPESGQMNTNLRSFIFFISIYLAFFASGASSLIAEVTWNRMLIVVVGNSLSATAMIIVVFMGGLGLGSYVGGKFFGKRAVSLVPYVLLEITIGIYVLVSPLLFELFSHLFTAMAESIDNRAGLTLVRMVVSLAALLLPASLMGATFPAMIAGTAPDSPSQRSARTGYLYSVNTLGAAVGCFAAGYHLLFEFGVQTTLWCAFGLYLAAAVCALAANAVGKPKPLEVPAAPPSLESYPGANDGMRRFLYIATFAIGFAVLAYEILLTRLSILYLGNSISVFALVLTGFLLGTGISAVLGTWLYGVLRRRTNSGDYLFGVLALAAGTFVLVTPYLLLTDWVVSSDRFARFADATPANPLPILLLIVAPTILIGALLPVAIRMLQPQEQGEATREAATLYALNTAGGLLGAGLANHYLVPLIGIQGTIICLALICAAVGIVNLLVPGKSFKRWSVAVLSVGLLSVILIMTLPGMMDLYAGKIAESTRARSAEVRLVHEGRAATVTVIDQRDPRKGTYRDMYLNGVEEASTRYWHTQLFKLLGIFPVLAHESDQPKEVLVIAFGAGITAGSVLASDQVAALDVVDLNPDVEEINNLFTDVNGDVFHQPRFHFHNDDGRNYLVTSNKRYDVIISDSTHPRAYDSWILYTEEFYRAVKRHLLPGAVFAQWVPVLGSMQGDLFRIHLNTFRRVFPNTTFWYVYGSDQAFLMATPEPLALDAERLQHQLDRLPAWFGAQEYQIDTVARIAGFFWLDERAFASMIGHETRINTDDLHYFDKQSAVWPAPPQWRLPRFQASAAPYFKPAEDGLRAAIRDQQITAQRLARFGFFNSKPDLFKAFCDMPENGNVRYWMSREFSDRLPDQETFCSSEEIRGYRAAIARDPNNARAWNNLAALLSENGQLDEALAAAERAVAIAPHSGMILDTYGWILFKQKKYKAAVDALEKSASLLPDHPIVLYHLGAALHATGDDKLARERLEKALSLSGNFKGADQARELLKQVN
jgi:spermidine synthase